MASKTVVKVVITLTTLSILDEFSIPRQIFIHLILQSVTNRTPGLPVDIVSIMTILIMVIITRQGHTLSWRWEVVIKIRNLRVNGILGVYEKERTAPRPIVINLALEIDGRVAANTDEIGCTVDYSVIRDTVVNIVETAQSRLIEHLATRIAEAILQDSRVIAVEVEVDKPAALRMAESVAVVVFETRGAPDVDLPRPNRRVVLTAIH